jgi:hypothetical protein
MSSTVKPVTASLRSIRRVPPATSKLVMTAKAPEIEMACPAWPSVMWRSAAIGGQQADWHELRRDQDRNAKRHREHRTPCAAGISKPGVVGGFHGEHPDKAAGGHSCRQSTAMPGK